MVQRRILTQRRKDTDGHGQDQRDEGCHPYQIDRVGQPVANLHQDRPLGGQGVSPVAVQQRRQPPHVLDVQRHIQSEVVLETLLILGRHIGIVLIRGHGTTRNDVQQ